MPRQPFDAPAPAPAEEPGPLTRIRMTVAYDGSGFRGFAAQSEEVRTVAGTLAEAVRRVLAHPVTLACAGRTDAGVHAWGQVVHFDTPRPPADLDLPALRRSLNKMLGPAVVVRSAEIAPEGFHARYGAVRRAYRYTVLNRDVPDPFLAAVTWQVEDPLDLSAMRLACDPLVGEHDFSSFCRRPRSDTVFRPPKPTASLVRRVFDARWTALGDGILRFDIEASSFCQQMVRSIVGTLVEVGRGRRRAGDMASILRSCDRSLAGPPAPPQGLCLWNVDFGA